MVAINILAAKAKICLLNIAPSGCGKSTATDSTMTVLGEHATRYTSMTLAGLIRVAEELTQFSDHIIIDDLGAEKSTWSRTATIEVLAHLVYTHYVDKISQNARIQITNFQGSASLNIQPVMMQSLMGEDSWVAVVRDKTLRYYHLIRPIKPKKGLPNIEPLWGSPIDVVKDPTYRGKLWYQLITIGLVQWSYARCNEHIPKLLRACAALDSRTEVTLEDYRLLIKLMKPMQLERHLLESAGFEEGRYFNNNAYCILVELASWTHPTINVISEDYKVHPRTVERLITTAKEWCFLKTNSPTRVMPTEQATKLLDLMGVNQKW